jgi:hypothetical protein
MAKDPEFQNMKKLQIISTILAVLLLNIFGFSQQGEKWIRKPLKFTRSQKSLTVKGTILAKKSVHCYDFKARENQRITAGITSDRNNGSFVLMEQDGDPFPLTQAADGSAYVRSYDGVLQNSTIFEICVNSERGKSNYTLQVTLE